MHGGKRKNAGKKLTGRKKTNLYITENELIKIKEFLNNLRKEEIKEEIKKLKYEYLALREKQIFIKSDGDFNKLHMLTIKYDDSFDSFIESIQEKYNSIKLYTDEIENIINEIDLKKLVEVYKKLIVQKEKQIKKLQNERDKKNETT